MIGCQCSDNILNHVDSSGIQLCDDECPAAQTLIDGKARSIEAYLRHKEGFRIPTDLCAMPVSISESIGDGIAIIFRDSSGKVAIPQCPLDCSLQHSRLSMDKRCIPLTMKIGSTNLTVIFVWVNSAKTYSDGRFLPHIDVHVIMCSVT